MWIEGGLLRLLDIAIRCRKICAFVMTMWVFFTTTPLKLIDAFLIIVACPVYLGMKMMRGDSIEEVAFFFLKLYLATLIVWLYARMISIIHVRSE